MPLNAGDTGYDSVPGPGLSASVGASESSPLLIPEPEQERALPVAAPKQGGTGDGRGGSWMEEGALLPGLAVLAVLAGLARHLRRHHNDEPTACGGTAQVVAEDGVLPDRPADGGAERGAQGTSVENLQPHRPFVDQFDTPDVDEENMRSLGIGALILEGLFVKDVSPLNLTAVAERFKTLAQIQHLLAECNKAGLKVVLDFCGLNLLGPQDAEGTANLSAAHALRFWLEQGVAGVAICDTDAACSEKVGGKASQNLKKLLLVLTMTLPGSPTVQYDKDIDQTQNVSLDTSSSHRVTNGSDTHTDTEKTKRLAVALFTSLSRSRAREEALLYGSFTFLPFNSTTNSSSNSTLASPSPPPILAFLRSWGCVHFLILLNVGPGFHALDPAWAPSLPEAGVFVSSTGMDRLGSLALNTLVLRPHEAIVIKLFETGSYS
ncbi:hypothetical protein D9C73_015101 [Collichthys lucidus]|uniref:Uncharacterized protein n=1 Tax=Collichthys lucidus TaxID=240159 RepID=A0A4U5V014_COLLU|nr:hypothetical protein D9C73_015101 [Collichthys lucidus]